MHFRKVVVGVDFSPSSLAAARWAATTLAPEAQIVLVHVLRDPPAPPGLGEPSRALRALHGEITPSLRGALHGLADSIDPGRVSGAVTTGSPADALVDAARAHGADVVCIGQTRTRRGSARFGATTANRVIARTVLPVAVASGPRPAASGAIDRVLVAVDDSADARAVVAAARRMARQTESELDVLHVLSPEVLACLRALHPERTASATTAHPVVTEQDRADSMTRAWLRTLVEQPATALARVETLVSIGDPGPEIVASAHARAADLIVLGRLSHGHDDPSHPAPVDASDARATVRMPLGSTARYVMWAAPCPILVLPSVPLPAAADVADVTARAERADMTDARISTSPSRGHAR